MKRIGLLVIHGIGTSKEDYDVPLKTRLYKRLRKLGKNPEDIAYAKVFWSAYVNEHQESYMNAARNNPGNRLDWGFARKFVMDNLSDAASYQRTVGQGNKNYHTIIQKIHEAVRSIRKELDSEDKPLIVLAHSLGGFVINNYIWDAHKMYKGGKIGWPAQVTPQGKFEHMVNLAGMVTFGCNIPLFVIGHDPIEAIKFPHPELADEFKQKCEWHNFYDPDDILGWPLRELQYSFDGKSQSGESKSYADIVNADHVIQVGTFSWKLWGWSPMSHTLYWTDKKLINPAAELLSKFL